MHEKACPPSPLSAWASWVDAKKLGTVLGALRYWALPSEMYLCVDSRLTLTVYCSLRYSLRYVVQGPAGRDLL